MTTWLQNKRKLSGLSQTEVAKSLGISRPTYNKLEQGIAKSTEQQKAILAQLLSVSGDTFEKNSEEKEIKTDTVYIREVPKENVAKFKQVLLYIVGKVGSRPNIGQTALYKLLYFIDFDYYEKYQKFLVGATYLRNTHGPSPVSFAKIVRELENEGELVEVTNKYFGYDQKKYLITSEPEVTSLSARELKHIDDELERLASKSARELSNLSHVDTPWRVAKEKGVLNYRHVFYRPDETSVAIADE
ncbi:MAG: type II toxin-antitoxin system antitoxin SocA domain-containing protein [Candidatus Paceibacterota bacterium]|jgi:transcriptional regulator with XRE-family HTH domain